jgi:hypothetical protein
MNFVNILIYVYDEDYFCYKEFETLSTCITMTCMFIDRHTNVNSLCLHLRVGVKDRVQNSHGQIIVYCYILLFYTT